MRRLCLAAMLLLTVVTPVRAAEIRWSGAMECRRELEVTEQVEAMTQRPLSGVNDADFELDLAPPTAEVFRVSLTTVSRLGGERSTRVFEGPSCADVTDAAAVAIALTIGATSSAEPDSGPVPGKPTSASTPATAPMSPPASDPTPSRPPPRVQNMAWVASVNGALDSSTTPNMVTGGLLRVGAGFPRFRMELEGALFAQSQTLDAQGRGGTFQLALAAPLVCAVQPFGRASALLCAGYELGRLAAEGEGVAEKRMRGTFWHAVRTELGATWPITEALRLSARLGGALALSRHAFVLDDPGPVHRPAQISLRTSLGVELRL